MGLTDKHLAYGDDLPQTETERLFLKQIEQLKNENAYLKKQLDTEYKAEDCISRKLLQVILCCFQGEIYTGTFERLWKRIESMPSVYPKSEPLTLEKAIDYLHEIGWMQEHDKAMTEYAWDKSVLEDIKAEVKQFAIDHQYLLDVYAVNKIIDSHISGEEQEGNKE